MMKEIWLITNYSCNNRCKWCYTDTKSFPKEIMPLDYAKEVLSSMSKAGIKKCTLIGGEPTLYPHIFELIEYGSGLGLFMKIVSNAVLLENEEYVKKLKNVNLSLIAISIHGINTQNYMENTQRNHFEKVIKAIKNCQKYNLRFITLTTLNRLNQKYIYDIAVFLNKLGVENIVYNIAVPNSKKTCVENLVLNPKEIAQVIEKNYLKLHKENIKAAFYASIPLCLFDRELLKEMLGNHYLIPLSSGGCNIYYSSGFALEPDGKLIPCCKKFNDILLETKSSNNRFIYKNNCDTLWEKIRNSFGKEGWKEPIEKCKKCSLKKNCIGGCKLFWEYYNPKDYIIG